MNEITTKVFKCEYCKKISLSKGGMTLHEKACKNNPANIVRCFDCVHFQYKVKTIEREFLKHEAWHNNDEDIYENRDTNLHFCKAKQKHLFSFRLKRKALANPERREGLIELLDELENKENAIPMLNISEDCPDYTVFYPDICGMLWNND